MVKRRRYSTLYFLHDRGRIIGFSFVIFLATIRIAQSVRKAVPDTLGTSFWFTTPLCDAQATPNMLVIPQTTEIVNVTIETLDVLVTIDNGFYTIASDGILHIPLPCSVLTWGQISTSGFLLTSTSEVAVYIEYSEDTHIVLPTDVFAKQFTVASPPFGPYQKSFIVIHGNASALNIAFPDSITSNVDINGINYGADSNANVTLPVNGVLAILCSCDLTGVTITSDLPVFILSGAKKTNSPEGLIETVAPEGTWGRKFLFPSHPWIAANITLVITGKQMQTDIKISSSDFSKQVVLSASSTFTLQLQLTDVLSIDSNSSIACAVLYSITDKSLKLHTAFRYITPVELFHVSYRFRYNIVGDDTISANVILKQSSFNLVNINYTNLNPFQQVMTYYWDYFISKNIQVSFPGLFSTSDSNNVPLHGSIFHRTNTTSYEYMLGMRVVDIYDACVSNSKAYGGNGDGIDNDCDNLIDEETLNKIDDDKDGLIDEDVRYAGNVGQGHKETVWEYHIRNAEKEKPGLSISLISIVISIGVALTSVLCFIGGMLLFEKIRRGSSTTRVTPIF